MASGGTAPRRWTRLLLDQMPIVTLLVLCLATAALSPRFLSAGNLANILLQASVLAVLAVGMTFVIVSGGFDLSVGSTVALAGCIGSMAMLRSGIAAGVLAGLLAGALVGLVNGLLVAKAGLNAFVATLSTMVVVRGAALLVTDGTPVVGDEGLPPAFLAYGVERILGLPWLVWTALAVAALFAFLLHGTAYGVRVFAVGGNRQAAFLAGVPVGGVTVSVYVVCGALAGLAGLMLAARLQSGQPTAGEFYELTAIAAVILGGASLKGGEGMLPKSLVGVLLIAVLSNSLNLLNVGSYWQRIAIGVVIAAAAAADGLRHRRR